MSEDQWIISINTQICLSSAALFDLAAFLFSAASYSSFSLNKLIFNIPVNIKNKIFKKKIQLLFCYSVPEEFLAIHVL